MNRLISQPFAFKFRVSHAGLVAIFIRARCKSREQTESGMDENLRVEINGLRFRELPPEKYAQLFNIPPACNGSQLKGLKKTLIFFTVLEQGEHALHLIPQPSAFIENIEIRELQNRQYANLEMREQAEDGDRRPWIVFILCNLPLAAMIPTITYARRKQDSDDVRIKIDGVTQRNISTRIKHFLWRFAGSLLPFFNPVKTDREEFAVNLPRGLHYIEFDADRMPILEEIALDFGVLPDPPPEASIPTVNNPKWTGDFADDTEKILLARMIFGETEGQPQKAKIGVGFTVLNRIKKQNPAWGLTLRAIILRRAQYDSLWNRLTFAKVRDPLADAHATRRQEWHQSYEIARQLLTDAPIDPTSGATHFHSFHDPRQFPPWATKKHFKIRIGNISFYELDR